MSHARDSFCDGITSSWTPLQEFIQNHPDINEHYSKIVPIAPIPPLESTSPRIAIVNVMDLSTSHSQLNVGRIFSISVENHRSRTNLIRTDVELYQLDKLLKSSYSSNYHDALSLETMAPSFVRSYSSQKSTAKSSFFFSFAKKPLNSNVQAASSNTTESFQQLRLKFSNELSRYLFLILQEAHIQHSVAAQSFFKPRKDISMRDSSLTKVEAKLIQQFDLRDSLILCPSDFNANVSELGNATYPSQQPLQPLPLESALFEQNQTLQHAPLYGYLVDGETAPFSSNSHDMTSASTTLNAANDNSDDSTRSTRCSMDNYNFIKVLGKGCMGKVLLAQEIQSSRLFAIKAISKHWVASHGPREIEHIRAEQKILAELSIIQHPFLIKLHCSFQNDIYLFLVLDYVGGGDLATQLSKWEKFSENRSRIYTAEIVCGVQELHRLGIIYRDLKPENILLSSTGHIILTDFGLSKQFRISHRFHHEHEECTENVCTLATTKTFCGTAEYLAPEVLIGEGYGFEVDWWSLGTFLYEMLTGVTPFWCEDQNEMYRRVLEDVAISFPPFISARAKNLISQLLIRNPQQRLGHGPFGIQSIMSHFFFEPINWQDMYNLRIPPPFVPQMNSEWDLSNFDEEFIRMTPRLSLVPFCPIHVTAADDENVGLKTDSAVEGVPGVCACSHLSESLQNQFQGYSYLSSSAALNMLKHSTASTDLAYHSASWKARLNIKKRRMSNCMSGNPVASVSTNEEGMDAEESWKRQHRQNDEDMLEFVMDDIEEEGFGEI